MRKFFSVMLIFMLTFSNLYIFTAATDPSQSPSPTATAESSSNKSNRKKTIDNTENTTDENEDASKAETKDSNKSSDTQSSEKNEDRTSSQNTDEAGSQDEKGTTSPEVLSDSAILINSDTGAVLFEKDADKKMYPASTTKIMTAYLALNRLDLSAQFTASKEAVSIASDSSKMGIVEGETLTAEELLRVLLIQSANDAANVLAEAVSGSIGEFVNLMNQTASELGMNNTHYANPHGYHDDNHYTTARDMSIIAQKAMENPVFAEIVSTTSTTIQPTNKCDKARTFTSKNALINTRINAKNFYQYANGIKTGYTDNAGQCLVGSAQKSGMNVVTVVFHAPVSDPDRAFIDTKNMFEYAFSKYRIQTVLTADELASTCNVKWASGKSHLVLKTNQDVKTLLPRENYNAELLTNEIKIYDDIAAPIKEGAELGEITYFYDGQEVAATKLYASRDVSRSYVKQLLSYVLNIWFLLILGVIVVIIILRRRKEARRLARLRQLRRRQNRGD